MSSSRFTFPLRLIWVTLLALPLFSELEFLGVKVKKEVKKAVEKNNEEVKASLDNLQKIVSQIQVSNNVAPQFTINSGPLPSEERIDNLIKEIHLLNEKNKDKRSTGTNRVHWQDSNFAYASHLLFKSAGALDPTSADLIIQMLRIANRGVHGEIIGQKYMDFASQAYPQLIDGLDNCQELIKRMT
mgnify:CR=1 FL=1